MGRNRRSFVIAAALVSCSAVAAAPARADTTVPANADVRVGSTVDADAFSRQITAKYHLVVRRVVATDIDRDGDLDFVAATDAGLLVWVNDGAGHLTAQPPRHDVPVAGLTPGTAWHGDEAHRELSLQNEPPTAGAQATYAHGPPAAVAVAASPRHTDRPNGPSLATRVPRAPPR